MESLTTGGLRGLQSSGTLVFSLNGGSQHRSLGIELDWNSLPGLRLWKVVFGQRDLLPPRMPVEFVPVPQANLTILPSLHVRYLLTDVSKLNGRRSNKRLETRCRVKG